MVDNSELEKSIRSIPDFPKKGIVFKDITTLLKDPKAFGQSIDTFYDQFKDLGIDKIASIESRGFVFGAPLAYKLKTGFVPIRKPGKLPSVTIKEEYSLEYGTDAVEIHQDAIKPGERVLILDDLLATGGTALAACNLVTRLGGEIVSVAFLIELSFLNGRKLLDGYDIYSMITYSGE